ncbi:23567_t:CDS:2, partial [Racocetra persica]
TEIFSQTNITGNPLHVLTIKHYQDDARYGRVAEINFDNTEEIQEINYCYVN